MEKEEIKDKLLKLILRELEIPNNSEYAKNNSDKIIETYFLMCPVENINLEIVELQNKLFLLEKNNYIEFKNLKNKLKNKEKHISFNIKSDYLIIFSKNLIENIDFNSIDNYLILNAGIQIKQEFAELFRQDGYMISYKKPYVVNGYNLPCKKLCKILYNSDFDNIDNSSKNILNSLESAFEMFESGAEVVLDFSNLEEVVYKQINKESEKIINKYQKNKKIKVKTIK